MAYVVAEWSLSEAGTCRLAESNVFREAIDLGTDSRA
jgi:hypothetical protein